MGFKPSRADPDIWMKSSKNGSHYEYIAVYVDDLAICIDRILTYGTLLDVLWQMYHVWITYGTVRRIA